MSAKEATAIRCRPIQRRLVNEITPPEGVPIRFAVAGLGARFGAQVIDLAITFGIALACVGLLALSGIASGATVVAVAALLYFFVRVPYYVTTELLWNGRTLGKRITGLQVISAAGRSLTPHQILARNLMKELEVFAPATVLIMASDMDPAESLLLLGWIVALVAVPLLNRRRQRIGDIIADTLVIHRPQAVLLPDLTKPAAMDVGDPGFDFQPGQLDHYGAYELQVLEDVLRRAEAMPDPARLKVVADRICGKIGYDRGVRPAESEAFLRAFYAAQRAYLERRKLYGDARADKFHRSGGEPKRDDAP